MNNRNAVNNKQESWYCPVCARSGQFAFGVLTRPGEVVSGSYNCVFTARCTGQLKRVAATSALDNVERSSSGQGVIAVDLVAPTVWKLVLPEGVNNQQFIFKEDVFFGPMLGKIALEDLMIELFLNFYFADSSEEIIEVAERKTNKFTVVHDKANQNVVVTLTEIGAIDPSIDPVLNMDLKGRGTVVISVTGDKEYRRVDTVSSVDTRQTDERAITVLGGAIAIAIDRDLEDGFLQSLPSSEQLTVTVRYRTRQAVGSSISTQMFQLTKTTGLTTGLAPNGNRYAVQQINQIIGGGDSINIKQYDLFVGQFNNHPELLQRGTVISSIEIVGLSSQSNAWIVLARPPLTTVEIVDDIDRVYGVVLSSVANNIVSDGAVWRGISQQTRFGSLGTSVTSTQSQKLVTRIGLSTFPRPFIFI